MNILNKINQVCSGQVLSEDTLAYLVSCLSSLFQYSKQEKIYREISLASQDLQRSCNNMTKQNWLQGEVFSFCGEAACSSCWLQIVSTVFLSLLFIFLSYIATGWMQITKLISHIPAGWKSKSGCPQHVQVLVRLFSSLFAEDGCHFLQDTNLSC